MLKRVDAFLNEITMYRLVLWGLCAMAAYAVLLSFVGLLSYNGFALLVSFVLIFAVCFAANWVFSKALRIPSNIESTSITALILFFLMFPAMQSADAFQMIAAGVLAMASKYVVVWYRRHIFNPAAFGVAVLGLLQFGGAVWWVGTLWMLPASLIVGLLIVRKIRRFTLFLTCVLSSTITGVILGVMNGELLLDAFLQHLTSWPIIFFASVMVTEPFTMPPRRHQQILYGLLVGVFSSWPIVIGPIYSTPELVLCIANLGAFAVSLRQRLFLKFVEKREIARDIHEYVFETQPFRFLAGQYLEWTLRHPKPDNRGIRRYFTIASSPTEKDVRLGVKIGAESSTYKKALMAMEPGGVITATQLAGDFVLPKDPATKLCFIAGGIGVTPFRSHIKYLIDTSQRRDIVLVYATKAPEEIAYRELFQEAEQAIGLTTHYIQAKIDESYIREHIPDYRDCTFHLSGPSAMVDAYKALLLGMKVKRTQIKTDYFPGFA